MEKEVIAAFGAAVILTALFLIQERRAHQPMMPLSLFTNRVFARTALIGLLVNIPFYGLIFVFSLYFQQINGLSPFMTGLAFVPMMGMVLPVDLLAPLLAERFGGPAIVAAGGLGLSRGMLRFAGHRARHQLLGYVSAAARNEQWFGSLGPALTSALLGSVEKSRSGVAAGVLNSGRQTGSVLGVALFGSLIGQESTFLFGMRAALVISAALLACAASIAIRGIVRK
jgi:MFS transporter, DHA2 family, methylenomycin A resistance protein